MAGSEVNMTIAEFQPMSKQAFMAVWGNLHVPANGRAAMKESSRSVFGMFGLMLPIGGGI